jgi:DNA (cytosine-5)-methyltransferase 1
MQRMRNLSKNPTAIDLFSGAGGFSLGLVAAGFDVLGAFDSWGTAVDTYASNFSHPVIDCDLSRVTGKDLFDRLGASVNSVDVLVGGPPCQGFSVQRIGSDHDVRNHLVLEFGRLVSELRPRLFLMENVPGLLGKRGKELLAAFTANLEDSGYRFTSTIVNAADYGVPQLRKRVVFAGWLAGAEPFVFPLPTCDAKNYRTVANAFADLQPPPIDLSPSPDDNLHRRTRLSPLNQRRMELIPPGGGMQDLPDDLKVNCHKVGADKIGHRYVYGRLAPDCPAATITARFDSFTRGKFGHPVEPRNITLREGARLQCFPDSFKFLGTQEEIAAQIGNAVPPAVAEALGRAAISYINGEVSAGGRFDQIPLFA